MLIEKSKDILREHIVQRLDRDIANLETVLDQFEYIHARRNEQLLTQGDICKYVYFVASGSLQGYIYDTESNETTRDIVLENN